MTLATLCNSNEISDRTVQYEPTIRMFGTPDTDFNRVCLKGDGTRAETRFRLSAKRTIPFKSAGGVSSVDYWQQNCEHQR